MLFMCPLVKLFGSIQECWDQRVREMIDLFVCSPLWPECQNHPHPVCKAPTRFIALKCASDNNHLQLIISRKWQQQISICCWKKETHLRSKHIHQGDSTRHMKSSGPTWLIYEDEQTSLWGLRENFVFVFVCVFCIFLSWESYDDVKVISNITLLDDFSNRWDTDILEGINYLLSQIIFKISKDVVVAAATQNSSFCEDR